MFSGKSTELARRIRRHKVANRQCLVVKYAGDTRYEDEREAFARDAKTSHVITHDRQSLAAVPCVKLADVSNIVHAFDVVGVDEGQFFGDLAESCEAWARAGKTVIVAALDATFQREPFNDVLSLVPIAEQVTKLSVAALRRRRRLHQARQHRVETARAHRRRGVLRRVVQAVLRLRLFRKVAPWRKARRRASATCGGGARAFGRSPVPARPRRRRAAAKEEENLTDARPRRTRHRRARRPWWRGWERRCAR